MFAEKRQRLDELERLQDDERLPEDKYGELCRLRRQIESPTPRQLTHGFKPGRLIKEDEEFFRVLNILEEMGKILEKEAK